MEHFMVRFKSKVGDLPAGIYEVLVDKNRRSLTYKTLPHQGEIIKGGFIDLRPAFWDNVEFLYEIDDDKE